MSVDEYALHLAQKYRLAISIAVLKTKPQNLSIDEYMDQIKKNINEQNDDFDVSVCSDDFRIDDDFENQDNGSNILEVDGDNGIGLDSLNDTVRNNGTVRNNDTVRNNSTIRNNDTVINNDRGGDLAQKSITETNNDHVIEKTKSRQTKFREMVDLLKGVDVLEEEGLMKVDLNFGNRNQQFDMDLTQHNDYSTFFESIERPAEAKDGNNDDDQNNDDKTQQRRIVTNHDNNNGLNNDITSQRFTKHDDRVNSIQDIGQKNIAVEEIEVLTINFEKTPLKRQYNNNEMTSKSKIAKALTDKTHTAEEVNNSLPLYGKDASDYSFNITRNKAQNEEPVAIDTQNIENTQFNTHYSESQSDMTIDRRYIHGIVDQKAKNTQEIQHEKAVVTQMCLNESTGTTNENMFLYSQDGQNMDEYVNACNSKNIYSENNTIRYVINDSIFTQDPQNMDFFDNTNANKKIDLTIGNINEAGNITQNIQLLNNDVNQKHKEKTVNDKEFADANAMQDANNSKKLNNMQQMNYSEHTMQVNEISEINLEKSNATNEDLTEFELETIPFKIMKEMNEVKNYLSRRDTISDSSDTGYRSKSQSKCSYKSTQPSNVSLDQNATSLLDYITSCLLVNTTQGLTNQISEVLGQLIDKLHEEEIYPTFLEQHLEIINNMLQHIYEEENYVDDVFQKKDEKIQRILLLNKSKQIQKFTIEKINEILQKVIENFSKNDTMSEIENINKLENLGYIFHILNVILQKYCSEHNSSQCSTQSTLNVCPSTQNVCPSTQNVYPSTQNVCPSTQNVCPSTQNVGPSTQSKKSSQEIRKSGISDIWRRKWIPNFKEQSNESFENKCVLKTCCTHLNRIIVDFMDVYSLIAYSALKCFNLMQSL